MLKDGKFQMVSFNENAIVVQKESFVDETSLNYIEKVSVYGIVYSFTK